MRVALKRDERIVEVVCLPRSVGILPAACVAGESVNKFVMAEVLRSLIAILLIIRADAGRIKQRKPKRVVTGLVGAGLRAGENGDAEVAGFVGEVEPAMRSHLESFFVVGGTFDCAGAPIVSGVFVGSSERERGFQRGFASFPVDGVREFDAIAGVARRQANSLGKF